MKRHRLAYCDRAGLIGALASCVCTFPLDVEPTTTGHHEACPAHRTLEYYAEHSPELARFYRAGAALARHA